MPTQYRIQYVILVKFGYGFTTWPVLRALMSYRLARPFGNTVVLLDWSTCCQFAIRCLVILLKLLIFLGTSRIYWGRAIRIVWGQAGRANWSAWGEASTAPPKDKLMDFLVPWQTLNLNIFRLHARGAVKLCDGILLWTLIRSIRYLI